MIDGYKCFDKGLVNRYGEKIEIGKIYHCEGEIKYHKNGFHLCKNLEDTFRFFDAFANDVDVTIVEGFGKVDKCDDEYNGFYDMYAVEYLVVKKLLTRDEVIDYALNLDQFKVARFLSLYRLTNEEISKFRDKFYDIKRVMATIDYYQRSDEKAFIKKMIV